MRALFIDFEDSFTYNVVQELMVAGLDVQVVHWNFFSIDHQADLLVLGPGPGHPDDYQILYPLIQSWLNKGGKIFAICLGHQILWRMRGKEVTRSEHPRHGQKVILELADDWQQWLKVPARVAVQRYNSLAVRGRSFEQGVESHLEEGEIMISRSENTISYQFHPESVGTKCRPAFFNVIFSDLL